MVRHLAAGYDFLKETWQLGNFPPRGLGAVKRSSASRDGRSHWVRGELSTILSIATQRSAWQRAIQVEESAREQLPPVLNLRPGCIFSRVSVTGKRHSASNTRPSSPLYFSSSSFATNILITTLLESSLFLFQSTIRDNFLNFNECYSTKNNSFRNKKILLFQREKERGVHDESLWNVARSGWT